MRPPPLSKGSHCRRAERTDAHDLMHLPFEQVESGKTRGRIRIAGGDLFGLRSVAAANHVDAVLAIRRRPGKKNLARFMLLLHPDQMLIQSDRPLLARLDWPAQNQ